MTFNNKRLPHELWANATLKEIFDVKSEVPVQLKRVPPPPVRGVQLFHLEQGKKYRSTRRKYIFSLWDLETVSILLEKFEWNEDLVEITLSDYCWEASQIPSKEVCIENHPLHIFSYTWRQRYSEVVDALKSMVLIYKFQTVQVRVAPGKWVEKVRVRRRYRHFEATIDDLTKGQMTELQNFSSRSIGMQALLWDMIGELGGYHQALTIPDFIRRNLKLPAIQPQILKVWENGAILNNGYINYLNVEDGQPVNWVAMGLWK